MLLFHWPFLDALQAGALLTLFASFGTDALSRRDRVIGWLALTCLLLGFRHGTLALALITGAYPEALDRLQSLLAVLGLLAISQAFVRMFPRHVPGPFPRWLGLAMVPHVCQILISHHPSALDTWIHQGTNLIYLGACAALLTWILKARQEGDLLGKKLFFGLVAATLPVAVEVIAVGLFGIRLRLSGLSLVILSMTLGLSWYWLQVQTMETRLFDKESEGESWRSLLPGQAFQTDQPSPFMENLFGPHWAERVKAAPESRLAGTDGASYRLHTRVLRSSHCVGWLELDPESQPGSLGFLRGWTIALGMDESPARSTLQRLLKNWGAEVLRWGTVPPREGPFPSVLIWGREPNILAVWRENDLQRRRPRWIQIGGPHTEGPHARLELEDFEEHLREILEGLISRH